jgi:lactate racemase
VLSQRGTHCFYINNIIVSTSGFPKDINLYQAQKSIDNAKHSVKEGGIMVVAAACKEGFGSDVFCQVDHAV